MGRALLLVLFVSSSSSASAQHEHPASPAPTPSGWHFMQDGVVFLTFNHQGGPIGETELTSQNWWMGMFGREVGPADTCLDVQSRADHGARLQSSVSSRRDPGGSADRGSAASARFSDAALSGVEDSGRHSIECRAGPCAGRRTRARSGGIHAPPIGGGESVLADWSSHVRCHAHCDGRHHGRLRARTVVRRSLGLHGREPDENRWDLADLGPLDSWAARVWFRPDEHWTFQVSRGWLNEPEALVAGDLYRTTASISWEADRPSGFTAVTTAYGRNDGHHGQTDAFLIEGTHRLGKRRLFTVRSNGSRD